MSRRRGSSHTTQHRGRATGRPGRGPRRGRGDGAPSAETGEESGGWVRHGTALPGWTDLETPNTRRRDDPESSFLKNASTLSVALAILAVAGLFTLYVGHVHATTDLYAQLQQARKENQQLHLKHNRLQGAYDRRTGPSVIYERARELGLRESVTYGPPITVE